MNNKGRKHHHMSHTAEYRCWASMNHRCYSETYLKYSSYGGRGITVCSRWRNSFPNFFADMGKKPPGTSLDRINNDGNYTPKNCRWATTFQQQANTRRTKLIELNGETHPMCEWGRRIGIHESTITKRLRKGFSVERALTKGPYWRTS